MQPIVPIRLIRQTYQHVPAAPPRTNTALAGYHRQPDSPVQMHSRAVKDEGYCHAIEVYRTLAYSPYRGGLVSSDYPTITRDAYPLVDLSRPLAGSIPFGSTVVARLFALVVQGRASLLDVAPRLG